MGWEKLTVQQENDAVIADEEGKVSSEQGRGVKLT